MNIQDPTELDPTKLHHVYLAVHATVPSKRRKVIDLLDASMGCTVRRRLFAKDEPGVLGRMSDLLFVEYAGVREGYWFLLTTLYAMGGLDYFEIAFDDVTEEERAADLVEGRRELARAGLEPGLVAPGVRLLDVPAHGSAVWIFEHGGECAFVEQPFEAGRNRSVLEAKQQADEAGWQVKYLLSTHVHFDHAGALGIWRAVFPKAEAPGHASFAEFVAPGAYSRVVDESVVELDLGGEPLLLLHAPKHSGEDLLVFFRGSCLSGDWSWGPYPDSLPLIPPARKVQSLDFVRDELARRNYGVHTVYSSHGNEARRDVDFAGLLAATRAYWAER